MGITQPGGAGTTIYLYDDTDATNHAAAPGPHTFAEVAAAFAADFVDNGTFEKSYRAKVNVQVGDTGTGTATTTLSDTLATVDWDSGKTLAYRGTQQTSWNTNLGTKVGSGNTASGRSGPKIVNAAAFSLRGTSKFYGVTLRDNAALNLQVSGDDNGSEMVNCLIDSTLATGNAIIVASLTIRWSNLYNVDFTGVTSGALITGWGVVAAERISMAAPTPTAIFSVNTRDVLIRDLVLFGSPTTSDMRWGNNSFNWLLVRPRFTGNAAKFSSSSSTIPALADATKEYWVWDAKIVDRNGAGIANIPVSLTDSIGTIQVDTTTGSDGELNYGSGLTAKCVIVADHYISSGYQIRHRSPYTVRINMPSQTGYNSNYMSRYYKFYWPGYETITTSSGSFEDMNDVVNLEEQAGNPTTWVETEMP